MYIYYLNDNYLFLRRASSDERGIRVGAYPLLLLLGRLLHRGQRIQLVQSQSREPRWQTRHPTTSTHTHQKNGIMSVEHCLSLRDRAASTVFGDYHKRSVPTSFAVIEHDAAREHSRQRSPNLLPPRTLEWERRETQRASTGNIHVLQGVCPTAGADPGYLKQAIIAS